MYAAVSGFRATGLGRILRTHCTGFKSISTAATRGGLPNHYTLPSGDKIPSVALGVWQAAKGEVGAAVKTALNAGYRHIDGAWIYGNEAEVGAAIKETGISREEIFITSKLWNSFHQPDDVAPALEESLKRLGTDYLDLYLIHWPVAFKKETTSDGKPIADLDLTNDPYPTWKALEKLVDSGKVKNIGPINSMSCRLQNLTANNLKHQPAVNQVELNFWNPQQDLVSWAGKNGVLLEAYSPLGSTQQVKETLSVPEIKAVAKELGITPAQAVISWHVQRGTIVLPKSVTPSRVEENFKVVKLPQESFDAIEKAATAHPPKRVVDPSKNWGVDVFED
ncbi:Aldo/keto reductase [Sistotremastrum niveocremeum HHB9708]|uniref:Aldo/keto reductase n=1 Tax=Sistotremastrum niveocremeum HHB9708 TaxID=1314777 RepID=A0A164YYM4_9AGAM|nr:Aldo/keto reductase [Sistotremastrum niveocremeum HHB9708]